MPWRLSTEMQLTRMNLMRLHQIVQFWLSIPIRDLSSHIITSYQLLDAMFGPQEHMTVDGLSKLKLVANDHFLQFPKPRHSGIRQEIATQMVNALVVIFHRLPREIRRVSRFRICSPGQCVQEILCRLDDCSELWPPLRQGHRHEQLRLEPCSHKCRQICLHGSIKCIPCSHETGQHIRDLFIHNVPVSIHTFLQQLISSRPILLTIRFVHPDEPLRILKHPSALDLHVDPPRPIDVVAKMRNYTIQFDFRVFSHRCIHYLLYSLLCVCISPASPSVSLSNVHEPCSRWPLIDPTSSAVGIQIWKKQHLKLSMTMIYDSLQLPN